MSKEQVIAKREEVHAAFEAADVALHETIRRELLTERSSAGWWVRLVSRKSADDEPQ